MVCVVMELKVLAMLIVGDTGRDGVWFGGGLASGSGDVVIVSTQLFLVMIGTCLHLSSQLLTLVFIWALPDYTSTSSAAKFISFCFVFAIIANIV